MPDYGALTVRIPGYEIGFTHAATFDEPLAVGHAIRWVGPRVWRVEEIDGERIIVRLWPDDEPYPAGIKEYGPGDWQDHKWP